MLEKQAKENERAGAEMTNTGLQKSVKAVNTQNELAKIAGVSHDTIHKVEVIQQKAPEETKKALKKAEHGLCFFYSNYH